MAPTQHTDTDESGTFDPDPYFQSFSEKSKEEAPPINGDASVTQDREEQTDPELSSEQDLPKADLSGSFDTYGASSDGNSNESSSGSSS
jgi:hypothetical protein